MFRACSRSCVRWALLLPVASVLRRPESTASAGSRAITHLVLIQRRAESLANKGRQPDGCIIGWTTTDTRRSGCAACKGDNYQLGAQNRLLRMEWGVARIPERRTRGEEGRQRHGDSAIAGALAYYASQSDHREYAYTPVPPARRRFDEIGPDDDDDFRRRRGWWGQRLRFGPGAW
jgi:hypothetical protein